MQNNIGNLGGIIGGFDFSKKQQSQITDTNTPESQKNSFLSESVLCYKINKSGIPKFNSINIL